MSNGPHRPVACVGSCLEGISQADGRSADGLWLTGLRPKPVSLLEIVPSAAPTAGVVPSSLPSDPIYGLWVSQIRQWSMVTHRGQIATSRRAPKALPNGSGLCRIRDRPLCFRNRLLFYAPSLWASHRWRISLHPTFAFFAILQSLRIDWRLGGCH
eukprot:scaffold63517_cov27-Tisochrysis_lutea.AAC.1